MTNYLDTQKLIDALQIAKSKNAPELVEIQKDFLRQTEFVKLGKFQINVSSKDTLTIETAKGKTALTITETEIIIGNPNNEHITLKL